MAQQKSPLTPREQQRLKNAARIKKYSFDSATHFFIPVMLDWGLFEIHEVSCANVHQVGYYDYPKAPYTYLTTLAVYDPHTGKKLTSAGPVTNPWPGSWENLYLTYSEALKYGPEICASPLR